MTVKNLMCVFLGAVLTLLSGVSDATCYPERCISTLKTLYAHPSGGGSGIEKVFVYPDETTQELAKLNCTPFDSQFLVLNPKDAVGDEKPMFNEHFSMLLAAGLTNKTVDLRVLASPGQECQIVYVILHF